MIWEKVHRSTPTPSESEVMCKATGYEINWETIEEIINQKAEEIDYVFQNDDEVMFGGKKLNKKDRKTQKKMKNKSKNKCKIKNKRKINKSKKK